jgi:hypothetical protein
MTAGTLYGPSGSINGTYFNYNIGYWQGVRGGTILSTNNIYDQVVAGGHTAIVLNVQQISRGSFFPCQTGYPANRQTGIGWSASSSSTYGTPALVGQTFNGQPITDDGIGEVSDPVYCWNDTNNATFYVGVSQYTPDDCGNGLLASVDFTGNIVIGVATITGIGNRNNASGTSVAATSLMTVGMGIYAPGLFPLGSKIVSINSVSQITVSNNAIVSGSAQTFNTGYIVQGQDYIIGTAKPGWTPYTYPHPLVAPSGVVTINGTISVSGSVSPTYLGVSVSGNVSVSGSVKVASPGGFGGPAKLIVDLVVH